MLLLFALSLVSLLSLQSNAAVLQGSNVSGLHATSVSTEAGDSIVMHWIAPSCSGAYHIANTMTYGSDVEYTFRVHKSWHMNASGSIAAAIVEDVTDIPSNSSSTCGIAHSHTLTSLIPFTPYKITLFVSKVNGISQSFVTFNLGGSITSGTIANTTMSVKPLQLPASIGQLQVKQSGARTWFQKVPITIMSSPGTFGIGSASYSALDDHISPSYQGYSAMIPLDANGDGYQDVFLVGTGGNVILYNAEQVMQTYGLKSNGQPIFLPPATTGDHVMLNENSYDAVTLDFDNDGDQDIFVITDGYENRLLKNNMNSQYSAVDYDPMTTRKKKESSVGVVAADFTGDGLTDIYITNQNNNIANELLINRADGTFLTIDHMTGASDNAKFLTSGDFDNDGVLDLYIVNSRTEDVVLLTRGKTNSTFANSSSAQVISEVFEAKRVPGTEAVWYPYVGQYGQEVSLSH